VKRTREESCGGEVKINSSKREKQLKISLGSGAYILLGRLTTRPGCDQEKI
jgi:hypothetical protein